MKAPEAPAASATPACCSAPNRYREPTTFWTYWTSTPPRTAAMWSSPAKAASEQTLAGKLPADVARRSGTRPIIAVAGRSLLPKERWAEMALSRVYTLAEYTDRDSARDPALSAALLRRIGQDIAAGLL